MKRLNWQTEAVAELEVLEDGCKLRIVLPLCTPRMRLRGVADGGGIGRIGRRGQIGRGAEMRVYVGRARPEWRGRRCQVVVTWRGRGPHNVRIRFMDGTGAVCPLRCLRKEKGNEDV